MADSASAVNYPKTPTDTPGMVAYVYEQAAYPTDIFTTLERQHPLGNVSELYMFRKPPDLEVIKMGKGR